MTDEGHKTVYIHMTHIGIFMQYIKGNSNSICIQVQIHRNVPSLFNNCVSKD